MTRKDTVFTQIKEKRDAEIKRQFNLEWPKVEETVASLENEAEYQFIENGVINEDLKKIYTPETKLINGVITLMAEDVRAMGYKVNILIDNSLEIWWQKEE